MILRLGACYNRSLQITARINARIRAEVTMNDPTHPPAVSSGERPPRRDSHLGRWLMFVAAGLVVLVVLSLVMSGGDGPSSSDTRAAGLALSPADLAGVVGGSAGDFLQTAPPVDVNTLERAARTATLGKIPFPDSRHLASYRRTTTRTDVTEAVLVYDDPANAAALDAAAAPLLGSTFGLMSEPITLDGAEDARRWSSSAYQAVTFRVDGSIGFVGTTDTSDPDQVIRLAERLRDKLLTAPTASAASTTAPR
jgi:hypothetical protein